MEKTKNKDNLRAAGKKRLQEYRQKRQQKESLNNSAKASAEDEQSIDHQTSDSISDPDGDEAASAGVVSTEEDNSTLTMDFALEVGNLQLSSLQLTRESIGSNGDFHRSLSFSEDEQERSRNDITSDAAGSHEEPQALVLYESEHERHGWNLRGEESLTLSGKPTQLGAQWQGSMFDRVGKIDSNMHQYNHIHDGVEEDLSCSWSEDTESRDGSPAIDGTKAGLEEIQCNCLGMESKDQIESILDDRSKLVASQLQTALEQIQAAAESEALSASELRGLQEERHHEKASFDAEVWKLVQQGLGKESICLMNGVNQPSQFQIKEVRVANKVDQAILEGCRRDDEQITTQGKEHAKSLDLEKLKTLSMMDDLGKWVQRLEEEENRQWVTACNESRHSQQNESVADVTGMKETEQQEVQRLEPGAESQMVQEQLQADGKIGIPEEAASQEEKDNEEATNSSSQLMELQQQLKTLEQENEQLASRFQAVEQLLKECNNENEQLSMQLQQREKREEEMSGELGAWKEHAHSLEVETLKYLSVIEKSHERLQRLEEENKRLVTSNDECGQSLKDALQEIMLLANELAKLEQEKDLQMGRTSQQAAALQKAQEQLQAASERDVCLVSELKELDAERAELQFKVREMQMQVQDLSADNVHLVAEVRRLDQKLEAVASEKRGLACQVDQLVQDRQRRDVEVAEELGTWKEHVRNLESEKLEFLSSTEALNQQIWRLGDDKKKLINESNQSLQELWGENARLKKEIGKLEAEKDRQEGERLELVAGLQTMWEKLQAANERETFLTKEVTGLQGRRDAELTGFVAKIQELQQQLQELTEKYDFVVTQSLETSRMLDELQMDKVQLGKKVSELVLERETREEEIAREKVTWKEQLEAEKSKLQSESENLKSVSEDLNEQLQRSGEEIRQLGMRSAELSKMLEELQEEKAQLVGELDKLEEVKEQQEGERLELAAKLQVAWNQLSEVRDSETHLTSELQILREERETERLKTAAEVQDLECQLHQVQEDKGRLLTRVQELTQTLEMLHDAKELQEMNSQLAIEVVKLEQEKVIIDTERLQLMEETQALKLQVQNVERDKSKLASEIEELNQWLHRPAAEKRQLVTKLDEVMQMLQRLQVDNSQLVSKLEMLEQEMETTKKENEMLKLEVHRLKEERSSLISEHEESYLPHMQQLEMEMAGLVKSSSLVQELGAEISTLKAYVFMLVEEKGNLRLATKLDEVTQLLQILHVGNFQLVGKVHKLEQEGEKSTEENRKLSLQVRRLDDEMKRSNSELEESHLQLQQLEEEMASLEKSSSLVQDLGGEISALKSHVFVLVEEKENVWSDVRVVQEQIQDVIQEGGQVLSPNIISQEEHPQELEMVNDHLASTLVQSEDELRGEKSELTERLDSYKQHDANRIALENSGDVTDLTQMLITHNPESSCLQGAQHI